MKTKKFLFVGLIGLISILSACEKDEERVVMLENPVTPSLQTIPGLTLERVNANQTLIFLATEADPGFVASANYMGCRASICLAPLWIRESSQPPAMAIIKVL